MNGDTVHNQERHTGHNLLSFPVPENREVHMTRPAFTAARQPQQQVLSLNSLAHALATGMLIGIPAGLLWGCFLESLWISSETASISLLSYYSFWALLGASFGVALFGTRSLKPDASSEPELSEIWSRADIEQLSRKERHQRKPEFIEEPSERWAA